MPNRYSIVGMNWRKAEAFVAGLPEGEVLTLVRDPRNEHDKNAVAVFCGSRHIGYLPKANNARVAEFIDREGDLRRDLYPSLIALDAALKDQPEERRAIEGRLVRSPNSGYPQVEV
jgi:hypothetical protein